MSRVEAVDPFHEEVGRQFFGKQRLRKSAMQQTAVKVRSIQPVGAFLPQNRLQVDRPLSASQRIPELVGRSQRRRTCRQNLQRWVLIRHDLEQ